MIPSRPETNEYLSAGPEELVHYVQYLRWTIEVLKSIDGNYHVRELLGGRREPTTVADSGSRGIATGGLENVLARVHTDHSRGPALGNVYRFKTFATSKINDRFARDASQKCILKEEAELGLSLVDALIPTLRTAAKEPHQDTVLQVGQHQDSAVCLFGSAGNRMRFYPESLTSRRSYGALISRE
jgi:hypothetical protein